MSDLPMAKIIEFLRTTKFFTQLDAPSLKALATYLSPVHLEAGKILLKQGDIGGSLFIVGSGRLIATVTSATGEEQKLGEIGRGEIVGEIAVMTGKPRTATVQAIRDSILFEFTAADFEQFTKQSPEAAMNIAKFCVERLITKTIPPSSKVTTITFAPAGENPYFPEFVESMTKLFAHHGSTLHVNREKFEALFGTNIQANDTEINSKIIEWLDQIELTHSYVIFETQVQPSYWTSRCLRLADKIILVGVYNNSPQLNEIEKELVSLARHTEIKIMLALLHRIPSRLKDTASWLKLRPTVDHHHLVIDESIYYEKLYRFITNSTRSLVLSGGGSRGFAYIGLFRALEELKISFDIVAGSSSGALVAGYYALGLTAQEMLEVTKKITADLTSWRKIKYTFPLVSIFNGNFLNDHLKDVFGNKCIEDLWTKYFCVSCNLTKQRLEIFDQGLMRDKLRMSMSVPALLPPVIDTDSDIFVDGGIMNNFPVDIMRRRVNQGRILGVSLSNKTIAQYNTSTGVISGWRLLMDKLFNRQATIKYPGIADVMIASMVLASARHKDLMKKEADMYIPIDASHIGLVHTKGLDKLIDESYQTCKKQLQTYFMDNTF